MNERIHQLAEQAYELSDISNSGELFEEKFAELIVRECAGLCSDPVVVLQHWGLSQIT